MLADSAPVAELARRLANLIRAGRIAQADYVRARVRVRIGDLLTGWLPWLTHRAGGDRSWWAPEVGEQVLVLSPDGEPAQGWVLPAGFSDAAPPPANRPEVHCTIYDDGAVIEYDRAAHKLTAMIPGDVVLTAQGRLTAEIGATVALTAEGDVAVKAPRLVVEAAVEINGDVKVAGNISATGSILDQGGNSPNHRH